MAEKFNNMEETFDLTLQQSKKYLHLGKFTTGCPQWLLDKVSKIDASKRDEEYIKNILNLIAKEFDPKVFQISTTNDLRTSRFINVQDILRKRQCSCGSKATVVAAVLRSLNIPTKLIHGLYIKNGPKMRHAWNEVSLRDGEWFSYDITRKNFKLDEYHIKKLEAVDWEEFENNIEKL